MERAVGGTAVGDGNVVTGGYDIVELPSDAQCVVRSSRVVGNDLEVRQRIVDEQLELLVLQRVGGGVGAVVVLEVAAECDDGGLVGACVVGVIESTS